MAGEAQAAADIMKTIFGQKQLGAPAPQFQAGQMGIPSTDSNDLLAQMMQMQNQPPTELQGLLAQQPQGQQELPVPPPVTDTAGLPDLQGMAQQQQQIVGDPGFGGVDNAPGFGEKIGGFFGNMDENMQSPSKVIGMGLLGRINPSLGYGGLLASGLFGKNKLF